jgi:hypothetical protein
MIVREPVFVDFPFAMPFSLAETLFSNKKLYWTGKKRKIRI